MSTPTHSLGKTGGAETRATPDVALSTLEYYLSEAENGWCKIPRRVVDDAVQSLALRASSLAAEKLLREQADCFLSAERDLVAKQDAVIAKSEQRVAALVGALTFYRDNWNCKPNKRYGGLEYSPNEALLDDCGNTARAALATEA